MGVWNAYGELSRAQLEQLSSDPGTNLESRIIWNTTSDRAKINTGSAWVSLLWNTGIVDDYIDITAKAAPGNPAAPQSRFYVAGDGELYKRDSTGTARKYLHNNNPAIDTSVTMAQVATPTSPSSGTNKLYFKSDNNLYSLNSSGTESLIPTTTNTEPRNNLLLNSNFEFWQAGTSINIANIATDTNLIYQADQWYVYNVMGTDSVATFARGSTTPPEGSRYYARVVVQTAPTANHEARMELCQTLDNRICRAVYNQLCSVSLRVRAVGNVNQIGVRLMYRTSEVRILSTDGGTGNVQSETTATIDSATWTTVTINNVNMGAGGTAGANDGVFGIVIRASAASSGNAYDLGNGYEVTQVMWNFGTSAASYQPQFKTAGAELNACKYYYERFSGARKMWPGFWDTTSNVKGAITYTEKRSTPTIRASAVADISAERAGTSAVDFAGTFTPSNETTTSAFFTVTSASSSGTVGDATIVGCDNASGWLEVDARF